MGRQAELGEGAPRRHRRGHGRRDGPAGVAPRRGAARDPVRHVKGTPGKAVTRNGFGFLMKAAVLGAGSWGTTFAQILCDAGTPATLWARRAGIAPASTENHQKPRHLPRGAPPPPPTA